ncbi:MAG: hypothetical protein QXE16_04365 [Candidatus Bathyarchaeia archaeon]
MRKNTLRYSIVATVSTLVLILATLMTALPASTQAIREVPTWLYITVSPNPMGVNQLVYVNAFFSRTPAGIVS